MLKLKQVSKERHPLKQLKIIYEAKSLISHEINAFYSSQITQSDEKRNPRKDLDAEQINRILAFVVLKAGITDLVSVIQLIEDFTTS